MDFSVVTKSESETMALGKRLSQLLEPGDVVGFFGDLGSGKTRMIRGICQGLNCADQVSSPTFTIINEYLGKFPVYHFDFYRLNSEREIFDLGYEEYFYGDGICLIEWAERVKSFFPNNHIKIYLQGFFELNKENIREIKISLFGPDIEERMEELLMGKSGSVKPQQSGKPEI